LVQYPCLASIGFTDLGRRQCWLTLFGQRQRPSGYIANELFGLRLNQRPSCELSCVAGSTAQTLTTSWANLNCDVDRHTVPCEFTASTLTGQMLVQTGGSYQLACDVHATISAPSRAYRSLSPTRRLSAQQRAAVCLRTAAPSSTRLLLARLLPPG